MNKKRLLARPVVCVVVGMIGASVMAAGSAQKNFTVTDEDGNDITKDYSLDYDVASAFTDEEKSELFKNLIEGEEDTIKDLVSQQNDKANIEDAEMVVFVGIKENVQHTGNRTVTFTGISSNPGDVFVIFHIGNSFEYVVTSDTSITTSDFSPFIVYRIAVQSSAQTGEYVAPYIVMIAGALVACGAVFAVRAKKATR